MYTMPKPTELDYSHESEILQDLIDLVKAGEITAVLLANGTIGWVPCQPETPLIIALEETPCEPVVCPMCMGRGTHTDPAFELEGICYVCHGSGVWEGK